MAMKKNLFIFALHVTPSGLFLIFALSRKIDYYFLPSLGMAVMFFVASIACAWRNVHHLARLIRRPVFVMFNGLMFSWFLGLVVLGVLNLTPFCVGSDNGDGINGTGECIVYTFLAGALFTPMIVLVNGIVAVIGGRLISRMCPQAGEK